jgi:hypothetical protein
MDQRPFDQLIAIQMFKSTVLQQFMEFEVSLLCSHELYNWPVSLSTRFRLLS